MRPDPVDVITRTSHYVSFTMGGTGYNDEPQVSGPAGMNRAALALLAELGYARRRWWSSSRASKP